MAPFVSDNVWCPGQTWRENILGPGSWGVASTCPTAAADVARGAQLLLTGPVGRAVLASGWVSPLALQVSRERGTDRNSTARLCSSLLTG